MAYLWLSVEYFLIKTLQVSFKMYLFWHLFAFKREKRDKNQMKSFLYTTSFVFQKELKMYLIHCDVNVQWSALNIQIKKDGSVIKVWLGNVLDLNIIAIKVRKMCNCIYCLFQKLENKTIEKLLDIPTYKAWLTWRENIPWLTVSWYIGTYNVYLLQLILCAYQGTLAMDTNCLSLSLERSCHMN